MKRILLFYLLFVFAFVGKAQSVTSAHFWVSAVTHQIRSVKIVVRNIKFEVSGNGEIIGFDYLPSGEILYYDGSDGVVKEGKIKSIGGIPVDYYSSFGTDENSGKLKSIGTIKIDYFNRFGENSKVGKLKSVGTIEFDYNGTFDDDDQLGKLKKVGSYSITYYNKFDAKELLSKVKTVGKVKLQYFDSFDVNNRKGVKSIQGNTRELYVTVW